MTSALLRKTLSELRERFVKLAEERERLRAMLVEVPVVTRTPPFPKGEPPGIQGEMVGFWNQCYRHPAAREDDSSKPKRATTPFFDVSGNEQRKEEGQFVDYADVGAVRSVRIEGDGATWERFQLLAADAGHLLKSSSAPIRSHFPQETIEVVDPAAPLLEQRKTSLMIQADLETAGVPYQDAQGLFADFPALRHSFITGVLESGESPEVVMGP